jgi:hypothetical protein
MTETTLPNGLESMRTAIKGITLHVAAPRRAAE